MSLICSCILKIVSGINTSSTTVSKYECQFNGLTNIKYMKLQILPFIVNSDNVVQVIAECLSEYVGDIESRVRSKQL